MTRTVICLITLWLAPALLTLSGAPQAAALAEPPASCPAVAEHELSPAETAYSLGHYSQARELYTQALAAAPQDTKVSAGLVQTLLAQNQISDASTQAAKSIADNPHSALALTALAEVQLRQGQPWQALDSLKSAEAADPCYPRIALIRSRVMRIDSMYASERAEVQKAYAIDPNDADIKRAYASTVQPAHEIDELARSLATMKDLTADARKSGEDSIRSMMPLLSENNQTCQILPAVGSITLPLQPSMQDGKHIDGYRLEVDLPKGKARLQVDTAASGLFISRAIADLNGFQPAADGPPGTVHADSVRIGPIEFRDCTVGVSDATFAGKADGFIGTDIFAQWLITLDQPGARLSLAPLPAQAGVLPGDRTSYSELKEFMPVYHRQQYLLVPVTLNNKTRQLFILDTGLRFSAMTPEVAHTVSTTKMNFTNSIQTVSGATLQVYRDSFDFQLANLSLNHQSHVLVFDPGAIRQTSGLQVAGMLGFDMLHSMVMHLDYRDGLVKLESTDAGTMLASGKGNSSAARGVADSAQDCANIDESDRPVASTIIAKVPGLIDSAHLKPGKEIVLKVGNEWESSECSLPLGSVLYGHVTTVGTANNGASELGLNFDQAECDGHAKRAVSFRVIGLVASPDQYVGLHNAMPTQMSGGGRRISDVAANLGPFALDENLNPGGPPKTVHPGIVVGLPNMKLEPQGGPGCSSKLTSTDRSVKLGAGAELILTMQSK